MASNVIREDVVRIGFEGDAFDQIKKLQKQCDELRKKLGLIDDEPVEDVGNSAEKSNKSMEKLDKATSKVGSGLKKLASISLKGLITGLGAASVGVGKLSKDAFTAYADYEQLIGGVDTLFKDSSTTIQKYANDAFKNTGMSANEYMQNAMSFSANLIQSTGGDTAKAAELANMALVDMSDNANKMGTDLQMVVETYRSIARGNYEMLDNLALGYGGTKTELQRLIKDAADLDKSVDANSMSYGNMVKAIHAIQTEMGITGTTQLEAEKTITGSLNMVKSAWENLMPALIQGGDSFDQCIENLLYSFDKFTDNAMPALEKALSGVGQLITTLAPKLEEQFPVLMDKLLPPLIKAASSLLAGFIKALPGLITTVAKEIPNIAQDLAKAIFEAFTGKESSGMESGIKSLGNALKWLIPILGGVVAAFKGLKAVQSVKSVFGGFGGGVGGSVSGGIGSMFKGFANIPITTVLKGIANISIIIGALGALLWIGTKVFKGGVDFTEMFQLITIIGLLGGVGGALALFASVVGAIPIPVVLMGLANIALVLGGLTLLIEAFGALSNIPGFNEFLNKGGQVLVKIFNILGEIVGSLIGGTIEGISNALPALGENLGKFGENIKPLFSAMQGVDMNGVAAFFLSLVGLLGIATGNEIVNGIKAFFGDDNESSLVKLGTDLSEFAENAKPFFDTVKTIPEAAFTSAKNMFEALSSIGQLPGMGGLAQVFTGDPYLGMQALTQLLPGLATSVNTFFTTIANRTDFSALPALFTALSEVSQLPSFGGLKEIFVGSPYQALLAMAGVLPVLGESVTAFFNSIGNRTDFSAIPSLFEALGKLDEYIDPEGGLFGAIGNALGGSEEQGLLKIGKSLQLFSAYTKEFFVDVNNLNLGNLNGLWESLGNASTITTNVSNVVDENIKNIVDKIKKLPGQMGDAIRSGAAEFASAFVSIWERAVIDTAKPVNKLLSGANFVLKEFGSSKRVATWTPYAAGTDGHKGGNALVNDGRGAELIQMPNGNTFIPHGRNVLMPNAPKGMKVLPAEQTARLMGKTSPTFRYAKGTGNFDVWKYVNDVSGLITAIKDNFVSYSDVSGIAIHISKGMISTITSEMSGWAKKLFDEFGAKSLASYIPSAGVEQWRSTVIRALQMEGQYSLANVERTLFQMQTESGGNPFAINLWDSNAKAGIPSKGLMQVIDPTFRAYARPGFDSNIYDPLSNILASIRYAVSRYGSLANAYRGVGYENGIGKITSVDLSQKYPSNNSTPVVNATNVRGGDTYAPVFNLTINGTGNNREMARQVKQWVKESMDEVFDSMSRRNPRLREV